MTFLEKIIDKKKQEVAERKLQTDSNYVRNNPIYSLYERVRGADHLSVIAEIKRASPSKGAIQMDVNILQQAKKYEQAGAAAISVLTDESFFHGSLEDLKQVSEAVSIPVLCKDFIIDEIQIDDAKNAGASIILLILAALPLERFQQLYNYATEQGLEVLCEVHHADELKDALTVNPKIVGINNRNLKTFEVDLQTTTELTKQLDKEGLTIISESGMRTKEDAELARDAGANTILVGETLMRSSNVEKDMQELQVPLSASTKGAS
ncbi:indole-3-glycerol phosphate synthase TrpC [Oceanobacillus sp. J11TS1]|uniref:indole-3-glycerol phosphate synthase TrpC n=1 Tax=Oceanobacillus sp. J11TS1 TaxID=2807191 RepID=UPI001B1063AB|nr:indole-3-glycerol phosphate synthase TrpC [Oceanobacillus sp. J11TS1]GIO23260.1 indole-3-glycerol phosphate synthase [Oceanobacillus sp. J11TS1]